MSTMKKELPCYGKKLSFIRAVHIDLGRLSDKDFSVIKDIEKDCSRIKKYKHSYAPYTDVKNAFILRIDNMALTIIVTKVKCIVIDIAQLVELK